MQSTVVVEMVEVVVEMLEEVVERVKVVERVEVVEILEVVVEMLEVVMEILEVVVDTGGGGGGIGRGGGCLLTAKDSSSKITWSECGCFPGAFLMSHSLPYRGCGLGLGPSKLSGDLPDPGVEPGSSALRADCLPSEPPGKPLSHLNLTLTHQRVKDVCHR